MRPWFPYDTFPDSFAGWLCFDKADEKLCQEPRSRREETSLWSFPTHSMIAKRIEVQTAPAAFNSPSTSHTSLLWSAGTCGCDPPEGPASAAHILWEVWVRAVWWLVRASRWLLSVKIQVSVGVPPWGFWSGNPTFHFCFSNSRGGGCTRVGKTDWTLFLVPDWALTDTLSKAPTQWTWI